MFTILHDLSISSTPQQVYDAVSQPMQLDNWWTLESDGVPEPNEVYKLYFDPQYDWRAEVTKAIPSQSFELKMTESDEDWLPTHFGFELVVIDDATRLQFYHKGWHSQNHHYRRTSYCWAILLRGLKGYVENGEIIPFVERT